MEIKKGYRFVCVKDVYLNGDGEHLYKKGNIYVSEHDRCITDESGNQWHIWSLGGGKITEFMPYSQLDKVYTKHTPLLEKIFYRYEGKKSATSGKDTKFFDNVAGVETSWFVSTSGLDEGYYKNEGYTYLSEQAFIEFMDLGKYIGSLNVESEEPSYSFPTDWYLNLDNPEIDINIIRDYLRGLEGINRSFITSVEGCLLGQDIMGDGSYQHWGSDKHLIEKKYNLVEISYQDFLDNVYRKKEVVGDTSQPKHEEEVPDYLKIAEEWSKEGEKEEMDAINPQKHYDNTHGSLYKIAEKRGWCSYQFDIVKRIDRALKKGQFEEDLKKTKDLIDLWLREYEG